MIRQTPQHTYQILTKRAERLPVYFKNRGCPQNVWLGVSVEDREYGVPRIDYLRQVDAHIRFLSVEPLLEDVGEMDLTGIHWVIVGGESGPKARPMKPEWVENVKIQADEAGAAFFFKQWGVGCRRDQAPQEGQRPSVSRPHLGCISGCASRLLKQLALSFHVGGRLPEFVRKIVPCSEQ